MQDTLDRFATIDFDASVNVLSLTWTEATAEMSSDEAKESLLRFAETANEHPGANLIVDVRHFRHAWDAEMDAWRDREVMPIYNRARVRRFAFLTPPGTASNQPPAPMGPATFDTAWMDSQDAIDAWFSSE
jgi:hypothetical protein